MGRTRTNKIVVFPPSRGFGATGEGGDELVAKLVDVRIERANGFSLYGTPILERDTNCTNYHESHHV
jgi:hypothetical protein